MSRLDAKAERGSFNRFEHGRQNAGAQALGAEMFVPRAGSVTAFVQAVLAGWLILYLRVVPLS
jgi:hypothetical protein